jgi:hypothetical protein
MFRRYASDGGGPNVVAIPLLLKRAGARFFDGGEVEDECEVAGRCTKTAGDASGFGCEGPVTELAVGDVCAVGCGGGGSGGGGF